MKTEKKLIESYGICRIYIHKFDGNIITYSIEISDVEVYRNICLENCYSLANAINENNPISRTLDIIRTKGE